MLLVYGLVYVPIDALLNWAFQLPREQLDQYPDVKPAYVVIAFLATVGVGGVGAITLMFSHQSKLIHNLQARVSRTEARASITEARLSEFSQALTDVRNTMADISINQKIQTDAVTKALEKMLEMSNDHLKAMDNLIKRIENLEPKRELRESI